MTRTTMDRPGGITGGGFVPTAARCQMLEQRLEDGYRRIEQALVDGTDVRAWEQFWLELLAEYEEICHDLAAAA